MPGHFVDEITYRSGILQRSKVIHKSVVNILGDSRPQRNVHYTLTHGATLFGLIFRLPLLMTKYHKFPGIVYGRFHPEYILLIVDFHGILVDPIKKKVKKKGHPLYDIDQTNNSRYK